MSILKLANEMLFAEMTRASGEFYWVTGWRAAWRIRVELLALASAEMSPSVDELVRLDSDIKLYDWPLFEKRGHPPDEITLYRGVACRSISTAENLSECKSDH